MEFESPKHSWGDEASLVNNSGTPLWLRRPFFPKLSLSKKHEVLTFLSPEQSFAGWRKSAIGVSRISQNPTRWIEITNFSDIEESMSIDESLYLGHNIFPSSRDISDEGRRPKSRGCENNHFYIRDDDLKVLSHFPCLNTHKPRGTGRTSTIDRLQYSYELIDHWQNQMNKILADNWDYKRK